MKPRPKQIGGPRKIRSKQVSGVAEYPTITLNPCEFSEGVGWYCPPPLLLCVGVAFELSGIATFAPAIIPSMNIRSFGVWIQFDAFDIDAKFVPKLLYYDKHEKAHQQISNTPIGGEQDKFLFKIPVEHLNREGWFACALNVDLITPLTGEARRLKMEQGQENPCHPMILRGAWLEIHGV